MSNKKPFQGLRSPREKLAGWVHLGRFVDKIRLNSKNELPADYQENFCKGFDGFWLTTTGVNKDEFIEFVKNTQSDAEVEAWVLKNVKKSEEEIRAFNERVLTRGRDTETADRFAQRKAAAGFNNRKDIQTFVDLIDADEGRM